jgi:hypothetical protein
MREEEVRKKTMEKRREKLKRRKRRRGRKGEEEEYETEGVEEVMFDMMMQEFERTQASVCCEIWGPRSCERPRT